MNILLRGRKLLMFVIVPMLGAMSPLLAIPAITSQFGASGWASVAVGQSVGMSAAVLVELGWSLNGPQRVARAGKNSRRQILAIAICSKGIMLLPIAGIAWLITGMLTPTYSFAAGIVAIGSASVGLTSTWFFTGTGSPGLIILTDSLPRITAVAIGATIINLGGTLEWYGYSVLVPALLSPVISGFTIGLRYRDFRRFTFRRIIWVIKAQMVAITARAISAAYIALPITLVSIVSPNSVPVFAALERLQRMVLTVLQAVPNFMQGWVGREKSRKLRLVRAKKAVWMNVGMGVISGALYSFLAPWLGRVLFSDVVTLPLELTSISGVLIFIVCCSRATGNISLVALRQLRIIMYSALIGALVGVPSILVLAGSFGARGALLGEVLAELAVLVVQLVGIGKMRKR